MPSKFGAEFVIVLGGVGYDNPLGCGGAADQSGSAVLQSAQANQQMSNQWMGMLGGVLGGAVSGLAGGFGQGFGMGTAMNYGQASQG